jgi:hypothetical protein
MIFRFSVYALNFIILLLFSSYQDKVYNIQFHIAHKKKVSKLRIELVNNSSDTLLVTPKSFFPKKIFEGKCFYGKLDFIFSISGVNDYEQNIFIDDGSKPKADKINPNKNYKVEFNYKRNEICKDTCVLVFRVFNPKKKNGVKYLVDLNSDGPIIKNEDIIQYYE